jgi:hypothetical protein
MVGYLTDKISQQKNLATIFLGQFFNLKKHLPNFFKVNVGMSTYIISLVVVLSIHPSHHPSIQVPHPGRRRRWKRRRKEEDEWQHQQFIQMFM